MGAMNEYKPYLVSWNLTKRCNLSCPHCYIDARPEVSGELTTDEAKLVIDELSYLNPRLMLVLSGGEPMLREDIFDLVEYATEAGFIAVMGSNGTLLIRENLKMLKEAGLKGLGISIDSVHGSGHDSFRGLAGAWEMSISALRSARDIGIETQMDVTLTDRNFSEIDAFVDLGASLSVKAVNFFFLVCTGRAMETDISGFNYEAALKKIAETSRREKRLMVRARCAPHIYRLLHLEGYAIPGGTRGCLAGRHYMRIDPEGNVTPCPYMPTRVGNVRETSLTSIWEGAAYLKLLRDGNYKGRCGICEYDEVCGGCRARALMEKGDLMEEDPLCTYEPEGRKRVGLGDSFTSDLQWDEKAKERMAKVPLFMKGMIIKMIEAGARERSIGLITVELIDELKEQRGSGIHGKHK